MPGQSLRSHACDTWPAKGCGATTAIALAAGLGDRFRRGPIASPTRRLRYRFEAEARYPRPATGRRVPCDGNERDSRDGGSSGSAGKPPHRSRRHPRHLVHGTCSISTPRLDRRAMGAGQVRATWLVPGGDLAGWLRCRAGTVDGDLLVAEAVGPKASRQPDELGAHDVAPEAVGRIPVGHADGAVVEGDGGHSSRVDRKIRGRALAPLSSR